MKSLHNHSKTLSKELLGAVVLYSILTRAGITSGVLRQRDPQSHWTGFIRCHPAQRQPPAPWFLLKTPNRNATPSVLHEYSAMRSRTRSLARACPGTEWTRFDHYH